MDIRNFAKSILFSTPFNSDRSTASYQMNGDASNAGLQTSTNNRDLRSTVEREFIRMNEAHDRHRTEVLNAYWPGMKLRSR